MATATEQIQALRSKIDKSTQLLTEYNAAVIDWTIYRNEWCAVQEINQVTQHPAKENCMQGRDKVNYYNGRISAETTNINLWKLQIDALLKDPSVQIDIINAQASAATRRYWIYGIVVVVVIAAIVFIWYKWIRK